MILSRLLILLTLVGTACSPDSDPTTPPDTDDTQDTDDTDPPAGSSGLDIQPGVVEHTDTQSIGGEDKERYFSISAPDDFSEQLSLIHI